MAIPKPASRPREAKLFRNNRSQAVRIPAEFELPGDRVLIRRDGARLILEPLAGPTNLVELLAQWREEAPLGPDDQLPEIDDTPPRSEEVL
ncbi:antitoxin [Achromobacter deleyi]|uniref:antitoxin n=1 Tax=Achromobacter deleyi TaxID=1353891 RepID=UPI0014688C99|nr:antitoxin [Achromobacter deleyi]CAB3873605.1 hypothetical protein LMG3412_02886 [Achromobacter deleyi]